MADKEELRLYTEDSPFAALNGIEIVEMGDGYAIGSLTVSQQHLNGTGLPHGGMYISLADSVFGAATRYLESTVVSLATNMEYIASAKVGDVLTCTCREVASSRRIPHHQAEIVDQDGKLLFIAHFTGYYRKPREL